MGAGVRVRVDTSRFLCVGGGGSDRGISVCVGGWGVCVRGLVTKESCMVGLRPTLVVSGLSHTRKGPMGKKRESLAPAIRFASNRLLQKIQI